MEILKLPPSGEILTKVVKVEEKMSKAYPAEALLTVTFESGHNQTFSITRCPSFFIAFCRSVKPKVRVYKNKTTDFDPVKLIGREAKFIGGFEQYNGKEYLKIVQFLEIS